MGYYVETQDVNITVKAGNLAVAYLALLELNKHDELKRGGSFGGPLETKWFSWMPQDLSTLGDLKGVIADLGFEVEYIDGDLSIGHYSNKTGQEDLLFDAIAPFVEKGSYAIWRGEDNEYYKWEFDGKKMVIIPGDQQIVWLMDRGYSALDSWQQTQDMLALMSIDKENNNA